ncbi:sigma 54-interacting transcriptional regulator [Chloracidobacterium validum]|uniref:Sigma 54-interacting transcriptional regulator n=1 Tax=Chloracidobacterium validum TaxID=2821543 RepID=A0ABX8BBM0_9BACT|nr:sigma 54-interacting transcriptional regulator [Chloracidobacterium validum]QUW04329.1 sigma 54-interacting transcriptional regulator [Chloracidobacterium validum]
MRYFDLQPADDLSALGRITQDIGDVSGRDPLAALKELEDLLSISLPPLDALRRCQIAEQWEVLGNYSAAEQRLAEIELDGLPDDIKAQALLRRASLCRWTNDAPQAIHLAKQALELARQVPDDECAGEAAAVIGYAYWLLDEYEMAYDALRQAVETLGQTKNLRAFAQACWSLTFVCNLLGRTSEAQEVSERGIVALTNSPKGDTTFGQTILGHLRASQAVIAFECGNVEIALMIHERALDHWMSTNDPRLLANGYRNVAEIHFAIGNWDQAEALLEQAAYLISESDSTIRCSTLITMSRLAARRGKFSDARLALADANMLASQSSSQSLVAEYHDALGETNFLEQNYADAEHNFSAARDLFIKTNQPSRVAYANLRLAETRLAQGDVVGAQGFYDVARDLAARASNLLLEAHVERIGGKLALAQQDTTTGLSSLMRSASCFESLNFAWQVALTYFDAGTAPGEGIPAAHQREWLETALSIFRHLGTAPHLMATEAALVELSRRTPVTLQDLPGINTNQVERLTAATASAETAARELAAIIDSYKVAVAIFAENVEGDLLTITSRGLENETVQDLAALLRRRIGNPDALHNETIRFDCLWRAEGQVSRHRPRSLWIHLGRIKPDIEPLIHSLVQLAGVVLELCHLRAVVEELSAAQRVSEVRVDDALLAELGFVGASSALRDIAERIVRIRDSSVTVLITGESGTGKEVVARAIHRASARRHKPFVAFNCAAVPAELMESQLFGHKKGAFTGADKDALGVIRAADGGTLFLDEIGELPLPLQPKLLRFLQEREVHPVGADRALTVDVRVIAATNRDLAREVAARNFREDLFHRLNVLNLNLPPLRERRADIPVLAQAFLQEAVERNHKTVTLSEAALTALTLHDWPGNARQLQNEIERVVALADDQTLLTPSAFDFTVDDLNRPAEHVTDVIFPDGQVPPKLADAVALLERYLIAESLKRHGGNVTRAAQELGISRPSLYAKCKTYGITISKAVGG